MINFLPKVGQRVIDSWYSGVVGVVRRRTKNNVWIAPDYLSDVPEHIPVYGGLIRYDRDHALQFLMLA